MSFASVKLVRSYRSSLRGPACAVVVLLGCLLGCGGAFARAQQVAAPETAPTSIPQAEQVVAGRVLSAADGHPLANARVTLTLQVRRPRRRFDAGGTMQNVQTQTAAPQTAQTDAEGRYRINAPAAGRYNLQASEQGYLTAFYLQHENFSTAVVTGAGIPTDNLNFSLVPEASLHGRILDDTGEPARASVMLYRLLEDAQQSPGAEDGAPSTSMAGVVQSDEDGQYQFSNLQPGRYVVAVTATPWYAVHARTQGNEDQLPYRTSIDPSLDVAYPVTFYPHATTEQTAVPIALKPGGRASANIVLQAEPALTLTVQLPSGDAAAQGGRPLFPALFSKIFGHEQGVPAAIVGRNGDTVQISGLAAGEYALRAMGRPGLPNAETPLHLSSGAATVSLPVGNAGATDLDIRMRTATGAPLDDTATVNLRRVGMPGSSDAPPSGKLEQGVAHFVDVQPGQYRVVVQQDGEAWTVSRLVVAGKTVGSRLLRVDGSPVPVEVMLSRYSPEVDGVVRGADGKVHPGSLAVLVPAGGDSGEDLFRADQSDLDGAFQFANVLPGNYLLVALDGNWKVNWRSTAAMMPYLQQAIPVTVPGSGPAVFLLHEPVLVQQK